MGDELRGQPEGYAEVGDQGIHYVEAGEGPLLLPLHGFPEYWYRWRQQIRPLAEARKPPRWGVAYASSQAYSHCHMFVGATTTDSRAEWIA